MGTTDSQQQWVNRISTRQDTGSSAWLEAQPERAEGPVLVSGLYIHGEVPFDLVGRLGEFLCRPRKFHFATVKEESSVDQIQTDV